MGLRGVGALLLAGLLAGCAAGPEEYRMATTSDYAMAAPEPAVEQQPQGSAELPPPVQNAAPPQGKFGVQVAAPGSVDQARAVIDAMRAKYPELTQQWAEILPVTLPKGTFYRVVIGPLASEQQASQLCSRLRAQGSECFIRRS
jgi:cell division septation protein DedD